MKYTHKYKPLGSQVHPICPIATCKHLNRIFNTRLKCLKHHRSYMTVFNWKVLKLISETD